MAYFKGKFWKNVGLFVNYVTKLNIPVYASHASFFIALAVFPLLVLLMSLLRYMGLGVETLTEMLDGVLPAALMPAATKLIVNTYKSTTGTVVSISALTALWSASRGIHGLMNGLNSVYGVAEDRGYVYTRLVSVVYMVLFLGVLLLTLVLHVFGTTLLQWLPLIDSPLITFLEGVVDLRFFLLLGVQTVFFTAIFMALPNKRNKLWDSLPGALLTSSGWLIFSDIYSVYVENFAGLSNIYGSVYAVALSLLWLYFCITIVFYGGALNHWLMHHKT